MAIKGIEEVVKGLEAIGGKLIGFYTVMGEYDYVAIAEAPSDEVAMTFLQEHLSFLLKSPMSALVTTSLVFGWAHVPSVMALSPGISIYVAFAYTTLIQGTAGLFYGLLWKRTKNLILLAINHALPDATSNLMLIIQWLRL